MTAMRSMANASVWTEPRPALADKSLIDHLFNRLDGAYPNLFRSAFKSEQAIVNWRETWVEALTAAGITPAEVKQGLMACYSLYDRPPSVAQFIKACRPAVDVEAAFFEAVEQMARQEDGRDRWSCKAVYWAAVQFGAFDLQNAVWATSKARWTRLLEGHLKDADLPEIPARVPALPAPGRTMPPPGVVRDRVAGLASALTGKSGSVRLQWARDILDGKVGGYVRGSAGVTATSRAMALRALRNSGEDVSKWVGEAA